MRKTPDLIGTAEAARILGVSDARVRQLILSGQLPATKLGRDHLLERRAVEKFQRPDRGRPRKS